MLYKHATTPPPQIIVSIFFDCSILSSTLASLFCLIFYVFIFVFCFRFLLMFSSIFIDLFIHFSFHFDRFLNDYFVVFILSAFHPFPFNISFSIQTFPNSSAFFSVILLDFFLSLKFVLSFLNFTFSFPQNYSFFSILFRKCLISKIFLSRFFIFFFFLTRERNIV